MQYVRVYATEDGDSAFEDVVVDGEERVVVAGVPPVLVGGPFPAAGLLFVEQGSDSADWEHHVAPRRQWVICTSGRGSVTVTNGETREFGAGAVLLAEDTTGRGHLSTPLTPDFAFVMIPTGD
jgi:quercetin dioxygenase-like cupin family protein